MLIGILQAGYVPKSLEAKHGHYPEMFEKMLAGQGLTFQTFVVKENKFPESIYACDGWLITGSSDGAYEEHDYLPPLEDFIRAAYAVEVPLVGICFGHQIMAQALGGKVVKYEGGWGIGLTRYQTETEAKMLHAIHQDQVVVKPADAEVIACSDFCANAGLAYRGTHGIKALSFQPHPEFTTEFMRDLIELQARHGLSEEQRATALAELRDENDSPQLAQQLADFFRAATKNKTEAN